MLLKAKSFVLSSLPVAGLSSRFLLTMLRKRIDGGTSGGKGGGRGEGWGGVGGGGMGRLVMGAGSILMVAVSAVILVAVGSVSAHHVVESTFLPILACPGSVKKT